MKLGNNPSDAPFSEEHYPARLLLECILALLFAAGVCALVLWLNTVLPKGW